MKKFVLFSSYGVLLFKENVHYWPPYFVTLQIDAFVNNFHFKKSRHHIFIKICGLPQQKVQKMVFFYSDLDFRDFQAKYKLSQSKIQKFVTELWSLVINSLFFNYPAFSQNRCKFYFEILMIGIWSFQKGTSDISNSTSDIWSQFLIKNVFNELLLLLDFYEYVDK